MKYLFTLIYKELAFIFLPLFLLLYPNLSVATGPSYFFVEIVPLAINAKGEVLFKTNYHENNMGGHNLYGSKLGWLVASGQGLWFEETYFTFSAENEGKNGYKIHAAHQERKNLKAPPPSLKKIMNQYHFKISDSIQTNKNLGKVVWSQDSLCLNKKCIKKYYQQRSILGVSSSRHQKASSVKSIFYHAGLALFKNNFENDEAIKMKGAYFYQKNVIKPYGDVGFDVMGVDAIVFLPSELVQ